MAGRPPKPAAILQMENGKQRRTKAELEQRKKAEESLLTGSPMKEWPEVKSNPEAHKAFTRLKGLLKKIDHHDAIHESVINRYCLLLAETKQHQDKVDKLDQDIAELERLHAAGEMEADPYVKSKIALNKLRMSLDIQLMEKRKMLLQIERENVMTIMGALRAIPKKAEKPASKSRMAEMLERKRAGRGDA